MTIGVTFALSAVPASANRAVRASAVDATAGGSTSSNAGASDAAGAPASLYAATLNGGYVAAGVGMRNVGSGQVAISGIPTGATVTKALLIWSVLGAATPAASYAKGKVNGTAITGTLAGTGPGPCWGSTTGYSYSRDVTALVTAAGGNGTYSLTGFASGQVDGADPFTAGSVAPMAEGASLVVVFQKAAYPSTRVLISTGYAMTSGAVQTATMNWGFAASNPVGEVRTTFIGGDGQTNLTKPASTFNNHAVTAADWKGTDPGPGYSKGNLWDTDSASVGKWVTPGQTSATVKVTGGTDCIVWAGQVLSIGVNGAADTDGDKLLDGWEANGYDADGNGTVDVKLPSASVVRKDLFVEMDYMGAETTCPCHLPLAADLDRIVSVFNGAPSANNPNGQTGIKLHLDAGAARGSKYNLGGGNLVPYDADLNPVATQFNAIKATNFNPQRARIYYYMIWAHGYDGGSSSGNAFAIPNDSFVVTLGLWSGGGSSDAKVGTFVHEFGHDLGLFHGGNDNVNYKPNYLSVMNYSFQVSGIDRTGTNATWFGYQRFALPNLNESSLNEAVGLNAASAATYRTQWVCPSLFFTLSPGGANSPLDWNCSGTAGGTVGADINGDGALSTLTSRDDWSTLVFGGGAVGAGASAGAPVTTVLPHELTREEHARLAR